MRKCLEKRKKIISFLIFLFAISLNLFGDEFTVKADRIETDTKNMVVYLYGHCVIEGKSVKLQANKIKIDKKNGVIVASGNVVFNKNTVTGKGKRLVYYTDSEQATIFKGQLILNSEYRFYAKEINYLSGDRYSLKDCTFTTCPEGCDYWGFNSSKVRVKKEGYATFNSLKFRVNRKSVFYLPFFIYPAKTKRTFGLLIPEFGNSSKHGFNYHQELFIPIGNPQDITLGIDYYSKAGTGTTFEYRESFRKGEFLKAYVYTIKDKLIDKRRTISTISYSYTPSERQGFQLSAFLGDDYQLIRDYTFSKYDLAMRDFYLYGGYFRQYNNLTIITSLYMQKPFFDNSDYYFSTLPSVSLYLDNVKLLGRNIRFKANFSLISNDREGESTFSRDYLEVNSSRYFNFKWVNAKESLKIKTLKYSSTSFENITTLDFSYKFNLPYLEKQYSDSLNRIKPFIQIGFRDKTGKTSLLYHDEEDYINPSGFYLQAGFNSYLVFNDKTAIFSLYGEKTLNSQKFTDIANPNLQSDYSTFNAYLSFPITSWFSISSLAKYNPRTNRFDILTFNTRISTLFLTYFRGYVYGEEKSRNSLIGRYDKKLARNWKATVQFDYDFSLNDFRYKRLTFSYYKKCIGVNITYQNNSYSTITTNQFTVSLVLRSIGELFKYRLGL